MIIELLLWLWTCEICECLTICVEVQFVMFYSCFVVIEWGLLGWVDILLHVVVMEVQLDEIGVLVFYIAYFVFSGLLVEYYVIWYSFPCFYTWVGYKLRSSWLFPLLFYSRGLLWRVGEVDVCHFGGLILLFIYDFVLF